MRLEGKLDYRARHWESSNIEEVWGEFKKSVMEAATDVCGMQQCRNAQERTRLWNEKVKQAIKNSKVAYLKWLQQQTPEAKERYQLAQKEAKRVVIYARNEEWAELGRSLQEDFQKNQKRFWSRVCMCSESRADGAGRIFDDSGQLVIIDGRHILVTNCERVLKTRLTTNQTRRYNLMRVPVTVEEVEVAILKVKNGKSPGICGISAEMLKAVRTVAVKWLYKIMSIAWKMEKFQKTRE